MVRVSVSVFLLAAVVATGELAIGQQTVLLDFSIPGCAPCRRMDPAITRLQQEGFPVRKVDASREPQLAQRFGIQQFPTLVLVAGGQEVHRSVGPKSYEQLRQLLAAGGVRQPAPHQPAPIAQQRTGVVPATFAGPAPQSDPTYQVGSDLGPAPAVTIPGVPQSPPAGHAQPAPVASAGPDPNRLLCMSVRLKVRDAGGSSFGTGTIIDARQGEALVLTCGHLFRDERRQAIPSPNIAIELFERVGGGRVRVAERIAGQLISYDFDRDVALISIRPQSVPQVAKVAASPTAAATGGEVWSVGCDRGADPTVRVGRVTTTDKYQSPPSLTATGAPVVGRSGGGLFNARGELVGVCFGADEQANEGFYAKVTSVHAELDRLGLTAIYRGQQSAPPAGLAAQPPAPATPVAAPQTPSGLVPVRPQTPDPLVRGQNDFAVPPVLAGISPTERAALEELSRRASESEVVCVIRPREPGGKSEVITLDRVSPQFLQALQLMQGGRQTR